MKKKKRILPNNIVVVRVGKMVLPFIPLTVAFKDVNYYVDTPAVSILKSDNTHI